jgi:hypothetical protein
MVDIKVLAAGAEVAVFSALEGSDCILGHRGMLQIMGKVVA